MGGDRKEEAMASWANRAEPQEPEKISTYDDRRAQLFPNRPLDMTGPNEKTVRQVDIAVWGFWGWLAHRFSNKAR